MGNKYELNEVTPQEMRCSKCRSCPAIYEKTPKSMRCLVSHCTGIYSTETETYLIVGKKVNPIEVGLEGKVGNDEVLIEVPKKLIDEREN